MRGFTLLELLIVMFIVAILASLSFPSIWGQLAHEDKVALASTLKDLREEAVSTKKEILFTADFKDRQFRISGAHGEAGDKPRIIDMKEGETWEVFVPSRGTIKEGEVTIAFTPSVQEELIVLYLTKNNNDTTIVLNNLSGEVEIVKGKKEFDE